MRFFEIYHGFILEWNSVGDYLKSLLARIIGNLLGWAVLIGIVYLIYIFSK